MRFGNRFPPSPTRAHGKPAALPYIPASARQGLPPSTCTSTADQSRAHSTPRAAGVPSRSPGPSSCHLAHLSQRKLTHLGDVLTRPKEGSCLRPLSFYAVGELVESRRSERDAAVHRRHLMDVESSVCPHGIHWEFISVGQGVHLGGLPVASPLLLLRLRPLYGAHGCWTGVHWDLGPSLCRASKLRLSVLCVVKQFGSVPSKVCPGAPGAVRLLFRRLLLLPVR